MRALIVGAGAVGQVYGYHLQQAGWEVGFLVRPKYASDAREGFTLFPLNRPHLGKPVRFEGFEVYDSAEAAAEQPWDQLWLAVSSTAILGDWLDDLIAKIPDTAVISLQPGPEGRARMASLVSEDRLIMGLSAFIAYQAPLPGEHRFAGEGIAYWLPPGPSPFEGPAEPTEALVDALVRGGCPAAVQSGLDAKANFGSALLQVHIAALEGAGWRWSDTQREDWLDLAAKAWREAAEIGAKDLGIQPPRWAGVVRPITARIAMKATPWVIPIDMETYLAYHFTKVGDQTRANLDNWIATGDRLGLPSPALSELRQRMDHGPPHPGAEAARH